MDMFDSERFCEYTNEKNVTLLTPTEACEENQDQIYKLGMNSASKVIRSTL